MRALPVVLLLLTGSFARGADERVIADFEAETYADWKVEGEAFGSGPKRADQLGVTGSRGRRLVNSFGTGDAATGSITSAAFVIDRDYLAFLIAGGKRDGELGIELLVGDQSVRKATGFDSGDMQWVSWDVRDLKGREARLRVFDRATGAWGHINLDEIVLTDKPRSGDPGWRLEDYRKSADYYREPFRPAYHFTPELNWMNDPNGLVFFEGEYHLFYQHNPHGNSWGHMSWAHAVSSDLLHWKHLPIALHDEYGTMAFSGSCVVDWKNTSGFGTCGKPPLVAFYTGHGHGRQTQDVAYSNDRGRTWTKYAGNPVIDIGEADFRDPKVFWDVPTKRWVMIVSLAVQKKLRLYGSANLKEWELLSEFGPAGVKEKLNWECPDLFRLTVKDDPKTSRWLLMAGMGSGAVAGGSGDEYLLGEFDGKSFKADPMESKWVDYGRDFYASVTWSDIPESDGRRILLGWMNNWETCLNPTAPWRSAMSIPRELSLLKIDGELRMCQQPVREIETLRDVATSHGDISLKDQVPLKTKGQQLEIQAEFEVGSAKEFGIRVLKGGDQQTVVGYDVASSSAFIDRTKSGNVGFHPAFAGRHAGPLTPKDGRIRLRILVDRSSVEVFGNDGETAITDLVFPDETSDAVEVYAEGGEAKLVDWKAWTLKSVWGK